jgi:predicted transcriptional regulator of viral defense system
MIFMSPAGLTARNRGHLARLHQIDGPFTVDDAVGVLQVSRPRAQRLVRYLADRGWLARVRRGVYVAVPLSASVPEEWRADLWRAAAQAYSPCYIAGWSACEHWGLTEQIFRDLMVVSARPMGSRKDEIQGTPVRIKVVDSVRMFGTVGVWRGSERVDVSDPSRTIVDLLDDPSMGGGIRHVAEVLEEYLDGPHRNEELLLDYCERFGNRSVYKRLGYLLEALGLDELDLIESCRGRMSSGVVMLDPDIDTPGTRNSSWNLRVNARIDRVAA